MKTQIETQSLTQETGGVVAHTGFEPVISSLRGRCPKPLDECAVAGDISRNSRKFTRPKAKSSQTLFTQALPDRFLQSRPSGMSSKSLESYHYTLDRFIGYPITEERISQYPSSLACHNGKLKFCSCLRAVCNWLYNNNYITNNPIKKVPTPRTSKKLLSAITEEQLRTLLNHCDGERDKAILSLLWYSGVRLSECTNVKASDFDWNEGTVMALGKGSKCRKALAGNGPVRQWFI